MRDGDRRGGLCSQLGCLSTCIFISKRSRKLHIHAGTHTMASLWDQKKAIATLNVETYLPLKTCGSPFTPPIRDKGDLYLQTSGWHIEVPEALAEWRSTTSTLCSFSSRLLHWRNRHRQNTLSATCTSDTDESSQTCLILSGWHSKIQGKGLCVNFSVLQGSVQR